MRIGIIIPNHNGERLLAKHLPGAVECGMESKIIVVDDASTDCSAQLVERMFAGITLIKRTKNGGFSVAANEGIRADDGEFAVLLNNDVEVTPGFLDPIMPLFRDDDVFAVSPRILLPNKGNLDEGAKTGFWHHGMLYMDQRQGLTEVSPILYATGCAAVYRRSMLDDLGGFSEIYSPFYREDADLGYRAWKRGWRSLYQPASSVRHEHSASISQIDRGFVDTIKARNGFFFIWRNIEDPGLLKRHHRWLPLVLAKNCLVGDRCLISGYRMARPYRDACDRARREDSTHRQLSDREIFDSVGAGLA